LIDEHRFSLYWEAPEQGTCTMANLDSAQSTITHSAALSLEERGLLAPIVGDPTDTKARAEYNRWLEANGDKRIDFARALAAFVEELNQGPERSPMLSVDCAGYSRAWTNMLGYPLFRGIAGRYDNELWDVRDILFRYAKPALKITPEVIGADRHAIHASRFGGHASLPSDVPWPTCSGGSMNFLGQIALQEIALTQAARELPKSGWLSFFAYDEWGSVGAGASEDDPDTKVIYISENQELVWRDSPQDVLDRVGEVVTSRLIFTEAWDLPDESDFVVTKEDQARLQEGNRASQFNEIEGAKRDYSCHLLGYSRHFRTSDPSRSADWRNLLCLSSVEGLGWNWCDGEHLAIFVQAEALRNGHFNRAFGYAS